MLQIENDFYRITHLWRDHVYKSIGAIPPLGKAVFPEKGKIRRCKQAIHAFVALRLDSKNRMKYDPLKFKRRVFVRVEITVLTPRGGGGGKRDERGCGRRSVCIG